MKFKVTTKPLISSLDLCVIAKNISNTFLQSSLIQLVATNTELRINVEAQQIKSEIILKGMGDGDSAGIIVSSLQFKQLINTITTPQVEFEFNGDYLTIHAGKSTYTLPKLSDISELSLSQPATPDSMDLENASEIIKSDWKFVKDYQLYARVLNDTSSVYHYAWVGEQGDVLVGDFVYNYFTHSTIQPIGKTCLLSDTIINLFNTLPDNTKLLFKEDKFYVSVTTDSYTFISELTPMYESEEVGDYNANIIMEIMDIDISDAAVVSTTGLKNCLNQSILLSLDKEFKVTCTFSEDELTIVTEGTNCVIPITNGPKVPYSVSFRYSQLRSVITNCPDSNMRITPMIAEDGVVNGARFDSTNLCAVVAGVQ